jgi:hypothetical protein
LTLFDPAYLPYSIRPAGKFDLVVCTDVLEHCSDEDVPWIVEDLLGHCGRFLYANIAFHPAKKTLSNGENAHCTIADGVQDTISGRVKLAGQSAGHIDL